MGDKKGIEDLANFFKSRFSDNLKNHLFLTTDLPSDRAFSPATRLIQRRREEQNIHKELKNLREEFDVTLCSQRARKGALEQKEVQIKEALKNFDLYLKETEVKQSRAQKKTWQERELALQKAADLLALKEELKKLVTERDKLARLVEKHEIYPNYLASVVKNCIQFQEPRQVMSRLDTLIQMREELLQSTQQTQASVESMRTQLTRYMEQKNDNLLHLSNKLAQLRNTLEEASTASMLWESKWVHIQNTAAKKTLLLGTIKMATLNIYQTLCKKTKEEEETVDVDDTLKQLDMIQTFFLNLRPVWEDVSNTRSKL